jgi:hypothetical protein
MCTGSPTRRAAKKTNGPFEGKSTSFWDDAWGSPTLKHTVLTADFSVPAPGSLEAENSQSAGLKASPSAQRSNHSSALLARVLGHSRSHAWFVIGIVAGLALSTIVWRRRRDHGPSQAD